MKVAKMKTIESENESSENESSESENNESDQCVICAQSDDLVRLPCTQCNTQSIENVKWIHKECLRKHILTLDGGYDSDIDEDINVFQVTNDTFDSSVQLKCPYCNTGAINTESKDRYWSNLGRWLRSIYTYNANLIMAYLINISLYYSGYIPIPWWVEKLELPSWIYTCFIFFMINIFFKSLRHLICSFRYLKKDIERANKKYHAYPVQYTTIIYD